MNADLIAQLLNILMKTYHDRTVGETARLTTGLWELACASGQEEAVREHLRNGRLRDYEAPANG